MDPSLTAVLLRSCHMWGAWYDLAVNMLQLSSDTAQSYFVSNVVQSAQHVCGSTEELHPPALLVLHLGRDGGPVRHQPVGSNIRWKHIRLSIPSNVTSSLSHLAANHPEHSYRSRSSPSVSSTASWDSKWRKDRPEEL